MVNSFRTAWRDGAFFLGEFLQARQRRNSGLMGAMRRRASFAIRDSFVLSYPKCGRTWLRTMIGRVIDRRYGLDLENPMELQHFWKAGRKVPCIGISHDDEPHLRHPHEMVADKSRFRNKKVLFLARDPRDVTVSYYFDALNRMKVINCSIQDFLYKGPGSIDSIIAYYNIWAKERDKVRDFKLVTYEDLRQRPDDVLRSALTFLGVTDVSDDIIREAVEFASFENLKKKEASDAFSHIRLRPADPANPESFKVRRGKVGGYRDYFSKQEIEFMDRRIAKNLDPFFDSYVSAREAA